MNSLSFKEEIDRLYNYYDSLETSEILKILDKFISKESIGFESNIEIMSDILIQRKELKKVIRLYRSKIDVTTIKIKNNKININV